MKPSQVGLWLFNIQSVFLCIEPEVLVPDVLASCLSGINSTLQSGHFGGHVLDFAQHGGGQLFDLAFVVGAVAHDVCMSVETSLSRIIYKAFVQVNISSDDLVPGHLFISHTPLFHNFYLLLWCCIGRVWKVDNTFPHW